MHFTLRSAAVSYAAFRELPETLRDFVDEPGKLSSGCSNYSAGSQCPG
jgi:hypothetical protein